MHFIFKYQEGDSKEQKIKKNINNLLISTEGEWNENWGKTEKINWY